MPRTQADEQKKRTAFLLSAHHSFMLPFAVGQEPVPPSLYFCLSHSMQSLLQRCRVASESRRSQLSAPHRDRRPIQAARLYFPSLKEIILYYDKPYSQIFLPYMMYKAPKVLLIPDIS